MKKIFNKIPKRIIIPSFIILLLIIIISFINYAFYSPSKLNKYIASNIYKTPANTAFTDQNFYNCVIDEYNSKNRTSLSYTTKLSDTQLKTINELSCSYKNITSAKGVEKLTALTELDVYYNQLTSLDVSKNTALTYLDVGVNQLTSLDVSKNTALTELDVYYNQLTSLDVSKNTALIDLKVYNNQLTSLDVSKNTALARLDVSGNQLTSLDVSKNTALRLLHVSNNQLTSLDVSKNTALIGLSVDANYLTSIDVSKNTALTRLAVDNNRLVTMNLNGAIALTTLFAYSNQLTSLDVSKNTSLTDLKVYNNQLTTMNLNGAIALTTLFAYNNQLTSLDVSKNTALTRLDVYNNQLVTMNLNGAAALTSLMAYENQLTSIDVSKNTKLTCLSVDFNQLTSIDVSNNKALTELSVSNNQLATMNLNGATALTKLYVYNNQLTSIDVSKNTALTTLRAYGNQLTNINLNGAAELTTLEVYENQLTSIDVSNNKALTKLYAYNNQLTSLDVSNNTDLIKLYVSNNQLTGLDVSKNTALTGLGVYKNQLTSLDVSNSPALTYLYADDNQLTSIDVSNNKVLTELYAYNNQLTSLDVSKNTALTTLKVYNNQLTSLDLSSNNKLSSSYLTIYSNNYNKALNPVLLGDNISINNSRIVKLPSHIPYNVKSTSLSDGLILEGDNLVATKTGTQQYKIIYTSPSYEEIYTIEVADIKSNIFDIDKTKDYIIVNGASDDYILNNIKFINCTGSIEDNYLVIKNGDIEIKRFKLVRISSAVYDLTKDYIYVSNTKDEDIINNISTNGNISITDNNLIITNGTYSNNFKLIRLDTKYDITNNYIYTLDKDILSNVSIINGDKRIEDNNLIISYNDIILDNIPIKTITSNNYMINNNYIYTGFKEIDISKIISIGVDLNIEDDNLIINNNNMELDRLPIYSLSINNKNIRFNNNKIYIREIMTLEEFNNSITSNSGITYKVVNNEGAEISSIEDGSILKVLLEEELVTSYTIEIKEDYIDYNEDLSIDYGVDNNLDILKYLSVNNTFDNIINKIDTKGIITIHDKDDNLLENNNIIKTGDKFKVAFTDYTYQIKISVTGDITGSGTITEEDVLEGYKLLRKEKIKDNIYILAADINKDGSLKINDIAKLYQFTKGRIENIYE